MKTVYLVRHGQTILNRFRRMQGWVDSPLTEAGERQASATGKLLSQVHFDLALSSDMMRAIRTRDLILAENTASTVTPIIDKNFREVYFGSFEGIDSVLTWNQIGGPHGSFDQDVLIKKYDTFKVRDFMHDADPFKEAETGDDLKHRIQLAFSDVQKQLKDGETALVVSHGTFIRNVATLYSKPGGFVEQPQNGSIAVLDVTAEPELLKYNQTEI
ncbi:phosphoglycerate mutase [Lentilactobacillus curieae]|uniref:Phosphoglycerate mutase n=1 Tax=Lentilactobacillus curieae TaxID=1138822 RepID=A0A1S6QHS6_9LACO|nr:histidine phosphatase family protein [Lentilactobacillus curieae]AQW21168.1 phosphoglycerate mutase [Lentilactobacillus curieae]